MAAPIFTSISVLVIAVVAIGIYDVLTNFEQNACEMTYMYEYPEYKKISLGNIEKDFPSYALYIYGEGSYYNSIKKLKLTGIPVLFIPGNAGSHKQVRSLASVSLRMVERSDTKRHFNYFAVDFNEELSALYGGVLEKQTDFVFHCVQKIVSLYGSDKFHPGTVVLVGHSMGGMIARALFAHPNFDHSLVSTIITQATPHKKPVAAIDADLHNFYSRVNDYWRAHSNTSLRHVTVVSTGGGYRDIQVRYALTALDGIVSPDRGVSASTTSVPQAWVSTDHLCAVWCRQMVTLTVKAMFGTIDRSTGQISSDADLRIKVFKHHFLSNNGLSDYLIHEENKIITLDPKVKWEVHTERLWKFASRKMTTATIFAIPLVSEEDNNYDAFLIMSNLTNSDWVCYCDKPQHQERCTTCTSLSSRSRLLPPRYSNSKYVKVMHQDIPVTNDTHILIIVAAGQKMVSITVDHYNSNLRHLMYHMPNTYDTIISYPISATDGAALLKISNGSTFYSLHLAGLSSPINAYTAIVVPQACRKHSAELYEGSVLQLHIPWSHEDTYSYSDFGKEASMPVKLQAGRPVDYDWRLDASEPHLEMFLHPYCHYQLKLLVATQDSLGQAARFYATQFPGYYVAVILMTLSGIIIAHSKGQIVTTRTSSPADLLLDHGRPYYLIPIVVILRFIIKLAPVSALLIKVGMPKDDATSLTEEGVYFTILPLLMYMCAWFVAYLQALMAFSFLNVIGYLGRLFVWIPDGVFGKLAYLRYAVTGLAILLTSLCGTIGIMCIASLLIMKILYLLYSIGRKLDTKDTHRKLTLVFPVMLLVNSQILLSLGPFVIWVKNAAYSGKWFQQLNPDPSRLTAVLSCVCVCLLLYGDGTAPTQLQGAASGWLIRSLAVAVVLYSVESLYRLPTFTSLTALIITAPILFNLLPQLFTRYRRKKE